MTTHTDVKHNPEICPICQKKAHQREEDELYEKWRAEFKALGGRTGDMATIGDTFRNINSFANGLTPEQSLRRQEKHDHETWIKFRNGALVVSLIILVLIVRAFVV